MQIALPPAMFVTRFDRFASGKSRANALFKTVDPTDIWLIPTLDASTNCLQYVYSVLDYLCDLKDSKERPLFCFDKNYVDFFDTNSKVQRFVPSNENLEWVNLLFDPFLLPRRGWHPYP